MKRRMITTDITSQGKFLRMSLSAQGLWLHLVANADDDGVVDAYTIMRMVGAKEDDMVLLVERNYITVLNEQEYIAWVTNWQEFNWIDPRIKEDSQHQALLLAKIPDVMIVESTKKSANKARYERLKNERQQKRLNDPHVDHMSNTGDPPENQRVRLGKTSIVNTTPTPSSKKLPTDKRQLDAETKIIEFLKTQRNIKSPSGYLKWLKGKYNPKFLPKLITIEFSKWTENLEYWQAQEQVKR